MKIADFDAMMAEMTEAAKGTMNDEYVPLARIFSIAWEHVDGVYPEEFPHG